MKTKYDNNPLFILRSLLQEYINNGITGDNPDAIIDKILLCNGYTFSENKKSNTVELYDDFYLYFISGASHGDERFYDYISLYGSKYLIIPLDYFDNINKERTNYDDDNMSIEDRAKYMMGLSNEFSALKTIVEFFISVSECNIKVLSNTIQGDIYIHASSYIAGVILLMSKCGLEENDTYGNSIPYEKIIDTLSTKELSFILMGIK